MSHHHTPRRIALGLLAAAAALVLGAPSSAFALAPTTCGGHLAKGADAGALDYEFGCSGPIIGYTVTFDQEIDGFDTEIPVVDQQGNPTNELFSCEGDFPSFGMGCFGTAARGGSDIHGSVELSRDACADPRYKAYLSVVTTAKGQTSGPFLLRGPTGCQTHTSQIKRLLAFIALLERARK